MWLAVVKRLNEPGITGLELKRLRLILMSLKGYAVVQADYYLRLHNLEEQIKEFHEHLVEEKKNYNYYARTCTKRSIHLLRRTQTVCNSVFNYFCSHTTPRQW